MENKTIITSDKSMTLFSGKFSETYHNEHGAFTESMHVYIGLGLKDFANKKLNILEIGYGTGLNAILTFTENKKLKNEIHYHGIDLYPISSAEFNELNYIKYYNNEKLTALFIENWDKAVYLDNNFCLYKQKINFTAFNPDQYYDLIYFDAFSPKTQPEMWEYENLKKLTEKLEPGGIFVTYCSQGAFKRNIRNLGLNLIRCKGPSGKRHVVKAIK